MLTTIRNAWKIPELRRKLLFTLVIILLYRIGNVIPVPGVNVQQMSLMFSQQPSRMPGRAPTGRARRWRGPWSAAF